jgi:hypothetical protein
VQTVRNARRQVIVGGKAAGFGRSELEPAGREVPRPRIQERSEGAVAVAGLAVADRAALLVEGWPVDSRLGVTNEWKREENG